MTAIVPFSPADEALTRIERISAELALVTTVEDAHLVVDRAEALRKLARKAKVSLEIQNRCAEIGLRAQRRGGELIGELGMHGGNRRSESSSHRENLKSIGVDHNESARWQRIASLAEGDFEAYIAARCNDHKELTTSGALQLARVARAQDPEARPRLHLVAEPSGGLPGLTGTFSTIVADPPWRYDNSGTRNAAGKHYPTMTVEELCDLGVEAHAEADAHLYLWTTTSFLRDAFVVLEAWGFTYKTNLVWVKPQMGMGNYFRVSHEHVLFGVRGSLPTDRRDTMSWFEAPRSRHSSKPECFLDLVERCSPGAYLEMFNRRRRHGWEYWGNE